MNNSCGHPHKALLNRIKSYTDEIYVTYETGNIVITAGGYDYQVNAQ